MTAEIDTSSPAAPSLADALEKLLPDLRAFAWSLCRDRSLADDLVQDACMKAWAASASFNPEKNIKPWAFQILRNEWRQYHRRAWRTQLVDAEQIERSLISESNAEAHADSLKATDAIYNLSEQHRDAIILILAVGMTYSEAAEVLGCSVGTVKSRLNRARKSLVTDLDRSCNTKPASQDRPASAHKGLEKLINHANQLVDLADRAA